MGIPKGARSHLAKLFQGLLPYPRKGPRTIKRPATAKAGSLCFIPAASSASPTPSGPSLRLGSKALQMSTAGQLFQLHLLRLNWGTLAGVASLLSSQVLGKGPTSKVRSGIRPQALHRVLPTEAEDSNDVLRHRVCTGRVDEHPGGHQRALGH